MDPVRNPQRHRFFLQAFLRPLHRTPVRMVQGMRQLFPFCRTAGFLLVAVVPLVEAVEGDMATNLVPDPKVATPTMLNNELNNKATDFAATKTDIDNMMQEFNNDLQAFNGDKQSSIYSQVVEKNTQEYNAHKRSSGMEPPANNWLTSPLYSGDAGISLDPGDGVGYGGPKELVNFSTYRDPATMSNPTLRSLQTQLNKINNIGSSAATQVNQFANRVKNSNNYFAKALKCSGFDWNASFSFLLDLETMKNYVVGMSETIAAAAPMALLGAYSPQLAELVKHFHTMTNFQLSAEKMDCSQMESKLKGPFEDMWGAEYSRCLQENAGLGVGKASDQCAKYKSLPQADGSTRNADANNASPATAITSNPKVLGENEPAKPVNVGNDQVDADAANAKSDQDATDTQNNLAGSGTANENAAALLKDRTDAGSPNKSMWDTVRSGWNDVTDNSLMNSLTSGWRMSATCTIDAGNNHWDLLKNLFDTESTKGKNALETALIDHFILLTGRVPVGDGNPAKTLSASRERLRQLTYGTRKSEWMSRYESTGTEGDAKGKDGKSTIDNPLMYRLSDTTLDGMALIIYRVATKTGDVNELNRIYQPGKVIEGIMRYEVICWYAHRFETFRERIKTSIANVKTATGQNKEAMDQISLRVEELDKKLLEERIAVEKTFVPWLPLYFKVRSTGTNRKKVNPEPGSAPYGYTSVGQWFSDTAR